ncbi:MAG: CoA transferase subunit A [Gammaproteobacteria bacterium]|nr:CoA transferase subunit A [Gammaproteobacteria bacterium]
MPNKEIGAAQVVAQLRDGMTIGIGGWGPRRKPMALVREILRSPLKDLTVVAYGGPEIGMLCAAGKVKKLVYGFVSLDAIPVEPFFRKAREAGGIEVCELDEGMLQWGLRAAGMRLPFLPTRVGLGTDVTTHNPRFKTIKSPYEDGEVLLALPAIKLDAALLHVDLADRLGNTQIHGPDPYFDEHYARAAERCYVSCEQLTDRLDLSHPESAKANFFERYLVTGVVHAPFGAHPTSCAPRYGWDMEHFKRYAAGAAEDNGWARYRDEFLSGSEAEYQARLGGAERLAKLPLPVF